MVVRRNCGNDTFEFFSVSFCAFISSLPFQTETCEVLQLSLAEYELYQKLLEVGELIGVFGCAPLQTAGVCCYLASNLLEMACVALWQAWLRNSCSTSSCYT